MEIDPEPGENTLVAEEGRVPGDTQHWKEMEGGQRLRVGDVVLLVDQNAPTRQWHLGLVDEVFPGQDGQMHVVQVITRGHKLIRRITRLCKLNTSDPEEKS